MAAKYIFEKNEEVEKVNILKIEATRNTPYVFFDPNIALLEMKGRSSPQDSYAFYNKIYNVLENHLPSNVNMIDINLALQYFNTSSAKCIFDLLKRVENNKETAKKAVINWYYENDDDDMYEVGEDYSSLTQLNFNILPLH